MCIYNFYFESEVLNRSLLTLPRLSSVWKYFCNSDNFVNILSLSIKHNLILLENKMIGIYEMQKRHFHCVSFSPYALINN